MAVARPGKWVTVVVVGVAVAAGGAQRRAGNWEVQLGFTEIQVREAGQLCAVAAPYRNADHAEGTGAGAGAVSGREGWQTGMGDVISGSDASLWMSMSMWMRLTPLTVIRHVEGGLMPCRLLLLLLLA